MIHKSLWYRKVDDTFAITSNDLGETLQKLNDVDENIEITMKKASKRNLPFVDCITSLNEKRKIITKVYGKLTNRSVYPFLIKSSITCKAINN